MRFSGLWILGLATAATVTAVILVVGASAAPPADTGGGAREDDPVRAEGAGGLHGSGGRAARPPIKQLPLPDTYKGPTGVISADGLKGLAPVGVPMEWTVASYGTASFRAAPKRIQEIVDRTCETVWSDEPPYLPLLVFGPTDVAWFESFNKSFDAAYMDVVRGITDGANRESLVEPVRQKYRELLAQIAADRVARDRTLFNRFEDGRLPRDMESGSNDRAWIEAMVETAGDGALWIFPKVLPRRYAALISVRDLPYVRRLIRSMRSAAHAPGTTDEERNNYFRQAAGELAMYLRSRDQ